MTMFMTFLALIAYSAVVSAAVIGIDTLIERTILAMRASEHVD